MRKELTEARKRLERSGYEHVCSVMFDGSKNQQNYGMQYSKQGVTFWLNADTLHQLPRDVA